MGKEEKKNFNDFYKQGIKLGSGAFSNVFKCTNKETKKEYAAKIVSRNQPLPGSRTKELMFDVEIRINEKLNHENIVNLHEVFKLPKLTLIFDLVTGGELFDDIERRQCYSEADAAYCIRQVLQGIEYIHSKGVIHRDLKPENLLLGGHDSKTIKIADFGLAVEFQNDEDLIFGTAGSPDYIAPEILNKHYYNKAVDIWSCGVILYILLCGYPPFETREDQKNGQFKFYAEDWQQIKVYARTLIVKMLTVNQKNRVNATEALDSKWIQSYEDLNTTHMNTIVDNIKKFNAKRKFKGSVQAVIATNKMKNIMSLTKSASTGQDSNESGEKEQPKSPPPIQKEELNQPQISKPKNTVDDSAIGTKKTKKKKKNGCAQQ